MTDKDELFALMLADYQHRARRRALWAGLRVRAIAILKYMTYFLGLCALYRLSLPR